MDLGFFDKIPYRNQAERFLYQGTILRKNQPEVSKKVVSISRVLTASVEPFVRDSDSKFSREKYDLHR